MGIEEVRPDVAREDMEGYARALLRLEHRPTAIVTVSDTRAAQVFTIAQKMGLSIPEDLSVTGFDDVDRAFTEGLGLTMARIDQKALAESAVAMLLQTSSSFTSSEDCVPAPCIFRSSTAPPGL